MIRNLRCTVTIDSFLANSKTQNAFLFTVNAIFSHDYPLAVEPGSTPRPLVQKKNLGDSLPIDMLLSAVCVLVVAQSSSEIPEGLMNNPVYIEYKCNRAVRTYVKVCSYTHLHWMLLQPLCSWTGYWPACAFDEVLLNKSRRLRNRGFWSEQIWYNYLRNVFRTTDLSRQIFAYKNEIFFSPFPASAILHNTQGCQETQSVPLPICTVTAIVTVMYKIVVGLVWMLFCSHSKKFVIKYLNSLFLIYVLSILRRFRDFIL